MAYNAKNKLLQAQKIIEIYQREKKEGISVTHVYKTFIYTIYPISRSTLYSYLSMPINRLLKEIVEKDFLRKQEGKPNQ